MNRMIAFLQLCVIFCTSHAAVNVYHWSTGDWSNCTKACDTGRQYRDVECKSDGDNTAVDSSFCDSETEPVNKGVCNTHKCTNYYVYADDWDVCTKQSDGSCTKSRTVNCYEDINNTAVDPSNCINITNVPTSESCDSELCEMGPGTEADILSGGLQIDFLRTLNHQQCHTNMYKNIDDSTNRTVIARRGCSIQIFVSNMNGDKLSKSMFSVGPEKDEFGLWGSDMIESISYNEKDDSSGWLVLGINSNAKVRETRVKLSYAGKERLNIYFTLFTLFNPYNPKCLEYVESMVDRTEYIENEIGLLWRGDEKYNSAVTWNFDQFHFANLQIAMRALRHLDYEYRDDIVLIARQISYVVGNEMCHGRWSGSYSNGHEPTYWTGTTEMFDIYRKESYPANGVRYCQCWVFASVTTTIGRSLGIATRPVTNFESSHDTDYNRGIEKYFKFDADSKTYHPTDGTSGDSVWNFHVWNEMYFKRTDFTDSKHNSVGWHAVDSTPQEESFGGNPYISKYYGESYPTYQMGPASLALIHEDENPNDCKYITLSGKERFGCFDDEFVISETNADYNFWYKKSTDSSSTKFKLLGTYETGHWGLPTIGQQMSTKRPGGISESCTNPLIRDCDDELLDVTLLYKKKEPSGPGIPTDKTNYNLTERYRRRMIAKENETIIYDIEYDPAPWHFSPMIVIADEEMIMDYYGSSSYTAAMIELTVTNPSHSNETETAISVYCSLTVTLRNYRGDKIFLSNDSDNDIVHYEASNMIIESGETEACSFLMEQKHYAEWMDDVIFDDRHNLFFRFTLSASIYDADNVEAEEPLKIIGDQQDFMLCNPDYMFRDRIICQNALNWFKPSYDLKFECDAAIDPNSVGDGFCDEVNNISPCYDGGDCCVSSCIPSDKYFCNQDLSKMHCTDDRVTRLNTNLFECKDPLSFIKYMEYLVEESICTDVDHLDFTCSDKIWGGSGNQCVDSIVGINGIFGDLEGCGYDTVYALSEDLIDIIETVTTCMAVQSDTTQSPMKTTNINDGDDKSKEEKENGDVLKIVIACVFLVVIIVVVGILYLNRKRKRDMETHATEYVVMPENEMGDKL